MTFKKRNSLESIAYFFLIISIIIFIVFFIILYAKGYRLKGDVNLQNLSWSGDYIAGVAGTLLTFAGTLFIILTFRKQIEENRYKRFEEHFYEMIRIHRENVSQLSYHKNLGKSDINILDRKVFKEIVDEFLECYLETKHFFSGIDLNDKIKDSYLSSLNSIITKNNLTCTSSEWFLIDLSYYIVYFGLSSSGKSIILNKFDDKLDNELLSKLIFYLSLKSKLSNPRIKYWKDLSKKSSGKIQTHISNLIKRQRSEIFSLSNMIENEIFNEMEKSPKYKKYYGGHQHRLGHYYRHLYQCYTYLYDTTLINKDNKYNYGKLVRAQLSTYEQILLFINSLSGLGFKWEYSNDDSHSRKLISEYNLIKNVPGTSLETIVYQKFYPNIEYEFKEK